MRCGKAYGVDKVIEAEGVPMCGCGGVIKPDVVLYEEGLDQDVLSEAVRFISEAEILIVGGTSLSVYPAAGLVRYYKGDRLVLINRSPTPYDKYADLLLQCGLGEVFSKL
jgi:NAD-dependent deacetylase